MAGTDNPPLDEIVFSSPQIAQQMGGIQTNTVLPYFSESPFFDKTSNNATLSTQAMYNPNMFHIIQTREAFEARLKSMQGLEFMVTHDPSDNGRKVENSGVWVIRKQNRRKRHSMEDEITALSSYFVIGLNITMAPTLSNVLGCRMLSTVTSLTKMLSTASALPIFTPALGYTYTPPVPKSVSATASLQATQTSIESTPMPETLASQRSTKAASLSDKEPVFDPRGTVLLAQSLHLSSLYNGEYMDENPLIGEPGSFILQKARDAPSQAQSQSTIKSTQSIPMKASAPPTPAPLKTDIPLEPKKALKAGEKTPITPGTRDKKRKKSKVAMTTPK